MSKKVSTAAIGAFVVGAIALTVVVLVIVGSGRFFVKALPCEFFFDGSVQGLSKGSPVMFKGVQIGEVTDIRLTVDPDLMHMHIPVRAILYPHIIELARGKRGLHNMQRAIEAGMRAQLKTKSLITGQLMITLDFYPDRPARYAGDGTLLEIPTIPSTIEELSKMIKDVHFDEILQKLTSAVEGIERLINSPDLVSGIQTFGATLKDVQMLVRGIDRRFDPLADSVISASDEYGRLAKNINDEFAAISGAFEKTLASAQAATEQLEKTLANSASITADGSPFMHELLRALREVSDSARAMRALADYIERHPESVIFGKGGSR